MNETYSVTFWHTDPSTGFFVQKTEEVKAKSKDSHRFAEGVIRTKYPGAVIVKVVYH